MITNILLEQQEIISQLSAHNKHLIDLLGQYMETEGEELRLERILRKQHKE